MKKKLLQAVLFFFIAGYSFGQSNIHFTGHGRALISNSKYQEESEFIKDDTSSIKKSLDGIFLFDLGIHIKPSDQFKASAILRVSNPFGGFYSTGSFVDFRQVQIQGILAKKVLYNIGDIDLQQSKYTLYNPYEPTYSPFEADAFKIKRDLVEYDNFNTGNKWRLQGVQAGTKVGFEKYLEEVEFSAFGTRTRASDFIETPDRLLYGGSLNLRQSRNLELGGNIISISDIQGTVADTLVFYNNTVVSGTYKLSASSRMFNFSVFGELGRSFNQMNQYADTVQVKTFDGFFDAGLSVKHRYIPISLTASYRLVGPEFSSPGAQTRRVYDNQIPALLSLGMSKGAIRNQTVFDRLSDDDLYNRALSTTLMYFDPMYNNATPYGPATPNRKGVTVDITYGNRDSLLYANVNGQVLSEVLGVGISQKRQFVLVHGGAALNVNKLIKFKKLLAISAGARYEKTTGSDAVGIDLTSMMVDAGITIETLKRLDLMGGIKYFAAEGSEIRMHRNEYNEIINYSAYITDNTQGVYTGGIRYRFTNYIFFAANAFILQNANNINSNHNYKMNQYFFSYIMRF